MIYILCPQQTGPENSQPVRPTLKRCGGELLRTETRLGSTEKRVYFSTVLGWELAALALLTAWLTRHARPQPWALGTLGWAVALVLIYASYDRVYGHNANV